MATIQFKRLTSTTLENCSVVLKAGEPLIGKDIDSDEYVVYGDGSTAVKDLTWEPIGDAAHSVEADYETIGGTGLDSDALYVMVSPDSDNLLSIESDGLFVAPTDPIVFGEDAISGEGSSTDPYTVRISMESDNILTLESDGLYIPKDQDIDGGEI